MVYDGRYKLIRGFDPEASSQDLHQAGSAAKAGAPLLFDLRDDPAENVNSAAKASQHVDRLSRYLA